MLFIFDFMCLEKHPPPFFLATYFIAIIDIFMWYQKTFWTIVIYFIQPTFNKKFSLFQHLRHNKVIRILVRGVF